MGRDEARIWPREWAQSARTRDKAAGVGAHDQAGRAQQVLAAGAWLVSRQVGRISPGCLVKGARRTEKWGKWASEPEAEAAAGTEHSGATLAWDPWHRTLETQNSGGDRIAVVEGGRWTGNQYVLSTKYTSAMESAG